MRVDLPADVDDAARAGGRPEATRIERIVAEIDPSSDDGTGALFAARRATIDRERADGADARARADGRPRAFDRLAALGADDDDEACAAEDDDADARAVAAANELLGAARAAPRRRELARAEGFDALRAAHELARSPRGRRRALARAELARLYRGARDWDLSLKQRRALGEMLREGRAATAATRDDSSATAAAERGARSSARARARASGAMQPRTSAPRARARRARARARAHDVGGARARRPVLRARANSVRDPAHRRRARRAGAVWEVSPAPGAGKRRARRGARAVAKGADGFVSVRRFGSARACADALGEARLPIWATALPAVGDDARGEARR